MASQADEMVSQDLEQVFFQMGWPSVKPEQAEVVKTILKRDVFVILPTGFGKSACYQCLPLLHQKLQPDCDPTRLRSKHCSCRYSAESFNERSGKTLKNRPKPA